jgi:hypothetical protein
MSSVSVVGSVTSWHGWGWDGWSALVAFGTILLALVTWRLARSTAGEIRLERDRLAAAQRPHVFPATYTAWVDGTGRYENRELHVIPVINGGPGVALNVRGTLIFSDQTFVGLVPTSLSAGQSHDMRLNWGGAAREDWTDAEGTLTYQDVTGQTFTSTFAVRQDNRRFFEFGEFSDVKSDDGNG